VKSFCFLLLFIFCVRPLGHPFVIGLDLDMAIEAQLYPNDQLYGSKKSMVCLNSQAYGHKHNLQQPGQQQCLQPLHHARQMSQSGSLVDPTFSSFPSSNVNHNAFNNFNHNAQPLSSSYPQNLATELHEQMEIDHYIRSQVSYCIALIS